MKIVSGQCPHCFAKIEFEIRPTFALDQRILTPDGWKMPPVISIVTITPADSKAVPFLRKIRDFADKIGAEFLILVDTAITKDGYENAPQLAHTVVYAEGNGCLESLINLAYKAAKGTWVLRLDDDEEMSPAMQDWIMRREFRESQLWAFPTMALWGSPEEFITSYPLWHDPHVRLMTSKFTSVEWPKIPHAVPSIGPGKLAPVGILHYKYLLSSYEERLALAEHYDSIHEGAGTGAHLPFTLPEDHYNKVTLYPVGTGYFADPPSLRSKGRTIKIGRQDPESFITRGEIRESLHNKQKNGMQMDNRSIINLANLARKKK